jgi:hypothetical protein
VAGIPDEVGAEVHIGRLLRRVEHGHELGAIGERSDQSLLRPMRGEVAVDDVEATVAMGLESPEVGVLALADAGIVGTILDPGREVPA